MKLKKVWVASDPTSAFSTMSDVLFELDLGDPLERYIVGAGPGVWAKEHTTLYTTREEAEADARERLRLNLAYHKHLREKSR